MSAPPPHIIGHTRRALASSPEELVADVPVEPPALFWRPLGPRCEIDRDVRHGSGTQDASPTRPAAVPQTTPRGPHAAPVPGRPFPPREDQRASPTRPRRKTDSHPSRLCALRWQSVPRQRPQATERAVPARGAPGAARGWCGGRGH